MRSSNIADDQKNFFEAVGLKKAFGHTTVLNDVTFSIPKNSVVSFVGENGAGKSTLFNILSGIITSDSGSMSLAGAEYRPKSYPDAASFGISRVFQEQALVPNITVYENLILGQDQTFFRSGLINRRAMIRMAEKIVEEAGLDVDVTRTCSSYDFSTRQSIEIARACLSPKMLVGCKHPLILLDEPTSALDRRDEEAFFELVGKIRKEGSLIFVSHRLTEVLAISDLIYVLKDGAVVAEVNAKEANENLLHGLMVGRTRMADHYCEDRQKTIEQEPIVAEVRGLSKLGEYSGVDLIVRSGEIVGIGGLLESGKSSLGKGIAGVVPPDTGTVSLNGKQPTFPNISKLVREGMGYVPAERLVEGVIPQHPLAWNFSLASADIFSHYLGFWRRGAEKQAAKDYIDRLNIRSGAPSEVIANLSGGNQQKVVLARWLHRNPKFLILDNPTRGVDAGAKEEIYRLMRDLTDQGVGIILITDELLELIGMSNRIVIMQNGKIASVFDSPADRKPSERELVAAMLS